MVVNSHWMYQGRQYHQWFGHGTAPKEEKEAGPPKPGSLFDPLSAGQRIDYASGSVIAHSPRNERSRWESRLSGANRESLKTAIAVWYGASKLTREAFHQRLLDPNTNSEAVDRLRSAAKGIADARSHTQLGAGGEDLAAAAHLIGLDRWPRFLGDAERRAVAAVSNGSLPGVMGASIAGADVPAGAVGLGLVLLLYLALKTQGSGPARPLATPSQPTIVLQDAPKDDEAGKLPAGPSTGASHDLSPGPGGVVISDDRGQAYP